MARKEAVFIKDINTNWANKISSAIMSETFVERYQKMPEYATISVLSRKEILPDGNLGDTEFIACSPNDYMKLKRTYHDCSYSMIHDKTIIINTNIGASFDMANDIMLEGNKEYKILGLISYEKCDWITILGIR